MKAVKSKFSLEDKKRIDAKNILKSIRQKNTNKLIFAHRNINLLRNKFELLVNQVKENIDVLMISKIKIDDSFPPGDFLIDAFSKPYRLDRDSLGGSKLKMSTLYGILVKNKIFTTNPLFI